MEACACGRFCFRQGGARVTWSRAITMPVFDRVLLTYSRSPSIAGSILWVTPLLRSSRSKPISCVAATHQTGGPERFGR
jgi:hypothetical protein